VEVDLYSFFNLGTRRGGWLTPRPAPPALPPGKRLSTHCIGGWLGPRARADGCGKSHHPPGFDPRTFQSRASRYTNWEIHYTERHSNKTGMAPPYSEDNIQRCTKVWQKTDNARVTEVAESACWLRDVCLWSVRLSARTNSAPTGRICMKFNIRGFYKNVSKKSKLGWHRTKTSHKHYTRLYRQQPQKLSLRMKWR
jgi:hypothetical protein